MIVFCEECGRRYDVDLEATQGLYHSFHCRECNLLITISKECPSKIISPDVAMKNQLVAGSDNKGPKKRILIVDDSKLFRRIIRQIIESDGSLVVVGEAANGHEALQLNQELRPDLITLDVNMPGMGGSSALKRFMLTHPCPVVIVSNLSNRSQETIVEFLRLGAVDFLVKPRNDQDPEEVRQHYLKTLHDAATAQIEQFRRISPPSSPSSQSQISPPGFPCKNLGILISGAGGIAELFALFSQIPSDFRGTLLVLQSIPEELLSPLVSYLNTICSLPVIAGIHLTPLLSGQCLLTPSGASWNMEPQDNGFVLAKTQSGAPSSVAQQKNDLFLRSVAKEFSGTFSITILSGAQSCSLETLRLCKLAQGKITLKSPESSILRNFQEELLVAGLADTVASPDNLLATILAQLQLS